MNNSVFSAAAFAALFIFIGLMGGQITQLVAPQPRTPFAGIDVEVDPALMPSTETTVFDKTTYVDVLTLSNESNSITTTCRVRDRQGTPRAYFPDVSILPNTVYVAPLPKDVGRKFPGGVQWSCANASIVVGYIRGWQR